LGFKAGKGAQKYYIGIIQFSWDQKTTRKREKGNIEGS